MPETFKKSFKLVLNTEMEKAPSSVVATPIEFDRIPTAAQGIGSLLLSTTKPFNLILFC